MRAATCSVGLVSPRSTWLSIGALTPERSARSRSDRSIASRSARTRGPMWMWVSGVSATATIQTYVITYAARRTLRPMAPFGLPDVLVLAGGGVVGEAWMTGVLAGLEDDGGADFRQVEAFVGTSAGSIVAARLVAGQSPRRPSRREADATPATPGGDG